MSTHSWLNQSKISEYYAHSQEGKPTEDWHRLEDHLEKVAEMARENWPATSTTEDGLIFES